MSGTSQKPDPYPNLDQHSVIELCAIGQEIVQEIQMNTINTLSLLRTKHNSSGEHSSVESLIEYAALLFRKLNEVRQIVDERRRSAEIVEHMSADEMLDVLTDPADAPTDAHCELLMDEITAQQMRIITLKCRLMMLEWMSTISDQRLVKRAELSASVNGG